MFNSQALLAQQPVSTTGTLEVSSVINNLGAILIDRRTTQVLSYISILIVAVAICIWCVHKYRVIREGGQRPKVKEVFYMLLLTVLLCNSINDMKDFASNTKNTASSSKPSINKVVATNNTQSEIAMQIQAYRKSVEIRYQSSFW